jgi:hypothetical protein
MSRWVGVRPGHGVGVACDGCEEAIDATDKCFVAVLEGAASLFVFHEECFEVYNRSTHGRRGG